MVLSIGAFLVGIGTILFKMSESIFEQSFGLFCTCVGVFLIYAVGKSHGRRMEVESQMRADGIPMNTARPLRPVRIRLPRFTNVLCRKRGLTRKNRLRF